MLLCSDLPQITDPKKEIKSLSPCNIKTVQSRRGVNEPATPTLKASLDRASTFDNNFPDSALLNSFWDLPRQLLCCATSTDRLRYTRRQIHAQDTNFPLVSGVVTGRVPLHSTVELFKDCDRSRRTSLPGGRSRQYVCWLETSLVISVVPGRHPQE